MKKNVLFLMKTVLVLSLVVVAGCKKDDCKCECQCKCEEDGKNNSGNLNDDWDDLWNNLDDDSGNDSGGTVPDPEGTVTANISTSSRINVDIGNSYGYIAWRSPDNFYLYGYQPTWSYDVVALSICDVGSVKGLGDITKIPISGYTSPSSENSAVACEKGHGYVVKIAFLLNGSINALTINVRLYVVEPISSGGAKVKYQYPFEP